LKKKKKLGRRKAIRARGRSSGSQKKKNFLYQRE
jgi:hypothetical protein